MNAAPSEPSTENKQVPPYVVDAEKRLETAIEILREIAELSLTAYVPDYKVERKEEELMNQIQYLIRSNRRNGLSYGYTGPQNVPIHQLSAQEKQVVADRNADHFKKIKEGHYWS